mmetsp:Transcript_30370/g.39198  ORF Transcript_30370/g.39198 Transcript_30370/m.39198 type:complete len:1418 (-) Transcript_30370:251-4504(-)
MRFFICCGQRNKPPKDDLSEAIHIPAGQEFLQKPQQKDDVTVPSAVNPPPKREIRRRNSFSAFIEQKASKAESVTAVESFTLILDAITQGIESVEVPERASAVVLLGNTDSGKKEIIDVLSDGQAVPVSEQGGKFHFPAQIQLSEQTDFYLDVPDFSVNKFPEINVANAVITSNILNQFKDIKMVICLTYPSLVDSRGKGLSDILENLEQLCGSKACESQDRFKALCLASVFIISNATCEAKSEVTGRFEGIFGRILPNCDISKILKNVILSSELKKCKSLGSTIQALDGNNHGYDEATKFSPSLATDDFQFLSDLHQSLELELEEALKQNNYAKVSAITDLVVEFAKYFSSNTGAVFLMKDSVVHLVKSHVFKIKQEFYNACLPRYDFEKQKVNACLDTLKVMYKNAIGDVDGCRIDVHMLEEYANKSFQLQQKFSQTRNPQEDAVVEKLMKATERLQDNDTSGTNDIEKLLKESKNLIKKLPKGERKNRYQKMQDLYEEQLKEKKVLAKQRHNAAAPANPNEGKEQDNGVEEEKKNVEQEDEEKDEEKEAEDTTKEPCIETQEQKVAKLQEDLLNICPRASLQQRLQLLRRCVELGQEQAVKAQEKKMVVFIGNTGSGKSTLINLLLGKKIVRNKNGYYDVSCGEANPKIGHGCDSETLFPEFFDRDNRVYCDCPGFFDTRGIEGSLGNAVSLYEAFMKASSIKVILLMNYHTLTFEGGKDASSMFDNCTQLFGSESNLKANIHSIFLGITHVPKKCDLQTLKSHIEQSDHHILPLLKDNFFINDPLGKQTTGTIFSYLDRPSWIHTKDLGCKVNLSPADTKRLVTILSELTKAFEDQLRSQDFDDAVCSFETLATVLPLLKNDTARKLNETLVEVVKAVLVPLREEIDANYCQNGSIKETEEKLDKLGRIMELVDEDGFKQQLAKHEERKKEDGIQRYMASILQTDEDAKRLREQCEGEKKQLVEFYLMMNGKNWKRKNNWVMEGKDVALWEGVTCNVEGRVTGIQLPDNMASGMLPDEFFEDFEELEILDLADNQMYGEVPDSLFKLKKMKTLKLDGNRFLTGTVPKPFSDKCEVSHAYTQMGRNNLLSIEFASFPMFVIPKEKLLKGNKFICHEDAKSDNMLLQLIMPENTQKFVEYVAKGYDEQYSDKPVLREEVMFLSHRWRGEQGTAYPDCKGNSKMRQLKELLKHEEYQKVKFIWMDYTCIPQCKTNQEKQKRAINSLAHYVKCCGHFSILLCDASVHSEGSWDIYRNRGWCRLERLSAMVPVPRAEGQDDVFTNMKLHNYNGRTGTLSDVQDLTTAEEEEINPLKGQFFDPEDQARILPLFPIMNSAIEDHSTNETLKAKMAAVMDHGNKVAEANCVKLEKKKGLGELVLMLTEEAIKLEISAQNNDILNLVMRAIEKIEKGQTNEA